MSNSSIHSGHRSRLRDKFYKGGLDVLNDHEVLELLLMLAIPRRDVNPIGHRLIARFGSLSAVLEAHPEDLAQVEGIGPQAAFLVSMIPQLTRRYLIDRRKPRPLLDTTARAGAYAEALFVGTQQEVLYLLCLDSRCMLKRAIRLTEGTSNSVQMDMQRLITEAARIGTRLVILSHNHPAGSLQPSVMDIETTKAILNALKLLDIRLVDHIIVGDTGFYSFMHNRTFASRSPAALLEEATV